MESTKSAGKDASDDMSIPGITRMPGLIGNPVEHAKSPAPHNYCLQKYGLDWAYPAFPIPADKAKEARLRRCEH